MKVLQEMFEDADFEKLKSAKLKLGLSWREFILKKCLENKQRSDKNGR